MPRLPQSSPRVLSRLASSGAKNTYLHPQWAKYSTRPKPESEPSSAKSEGTDLIQQEDPPEPFILPSKHHFPPVDHATSTFSPPQKYVMDGSEPGETLPAAVLSGAPIDLQARTVRIYKPAKAATQSGENHGRHWRMDWDILQKGHRWENALMGWQSSGDYLQGTGLFFKTKDDAIHFAEKQGYEYFVQEPNERRILPKAYANNFMYSPNKLKHIRTK